MFERLLYNSRVIYNNSYTYSYFVVYNGVGDLQAVLLFIEI